jgi:hypothetical protein
MSESVQADLIRREIEATRARIAAGLVELRGREWRARQTARSILLTSAAAAAILALIFRYRERRSRS